MSLCMFSQGGLSGSKRTHTLLACHLSCLKGVVSNTWVSRCPSAPTALPPPLKKTAHPVLPCLCWLEKETRPHQATRSVWSSWMAETTLSELQLAPHELKTTAAIDYNVICSSVSIGYMCSWLFAAHWEKFQRSHPSHPTVPRIAPRFGHPSALPSSVSHLCTPVGWAAPKACQLPSSPTSHLQCSQEACSSAARFPAVTRMSWIHLVSVEATARFPSRRRRTQTPSISTVQPTPACPWLTARPTSLPLRSSSQSAVPTRDQGRTRAARRKGGSSRSSLRTTWRTTGQIL